ncbi:MAG: hypothetical protein ABI026_12255 [Gemmatimonadaceae bacterium]
MKFRLLALLSTSAVVGLAACSSDQHSATATVEPAASATRLIPGTQLRCQIVSQLQIITLFQGRDIGKATSQLAHIDRDIARRQNDQATAEMFSLWKFTLDAYYAGNLRGGSTAQTQARTLALGNALYCLLGLDGSQLSLSSLDPGAVVQVVVPADTQQTVVTGDKQAGMAIPPGTLTAPVTVVITPITTPYTFPTGPLHTKLDQYGPFFEFQLVPSQTLATPVLVAGCIATPQGDAPPSSVDLAHNVGAGIEILPKQQVSFLLCGGTALASQPSAFELASNGEYGKAIKRIGTSVVDLFTPTQAYASAAGIGGLTRNFSPFGGVDTTVVMKLTAGFPAQPQLAPAGSNVAAAPTALIETINGHTPLGGASVTMMVATGGGSIGPSTNASRVTTTTLTSDGTTGVAGVPNWTLGAGPANTVTASGSFTLPAIVSGLPVIGAEAGAGIVVTGNPLAFTATSTDVVPYQATGYQYLAGAVGLEPGFEKSTYSAPVGANWQTGQAAFGSSNLNGSCPALVSTVVSPWANNPGGSSDMLLRKSFTLPAWWTGSLSVGIAVDNDFMAYVDGTNVTPTNVSSYDPSSGFVTHEGCAARDSFIFPITPGGGTHTLAIRARDRGMAAYVDTKIGVTP